MSISKKEIFDYQTERLVSSDHLGTTKSVIIDSNFIDVIDSKLVKMIIWYDNEWGYSNRVIDIAKYVLNKKISMTIEENKVYALVIGKKKHRFSGKNIMNINGQPSCEYGFQAAKRIGIKNIFVSTDCELFQKLAQGIQLN